MTPREMVVELAARRQVLEWFVAVRTKSEMNARDHWSKRKRRFDEQKAATWLEFRAKYPNSVRVQFIDRDWNRVPVVVTLTRHGRKLDSDNLQSALKAIRDTVAAILGIDDGDEDAATWICRNGAVKSEGKEIVGVSVRIEPRAGG